MMVSKMILTWPCVLFNKPYESQTLLHKLMPKSFNLFFSNSTVFFQIVFKVNIEILDFQITKSMNCCNGM